MIKLLQSPWVGSGLGSVLFLLTLVLSWQRPPPLQSTVASEGSHKTGPSWTFQNPEVDQLVGELKKEKEGLALKQKELEELAKRLQIERQELNQVTQAVHTLQVEFDRSVVRVEEQEVSNLKKLAKIYSTMAPENAVLILKQMDETTLVKILALMKDSETAPILESLGKQGETEAKRAAAISERLRLTLTKPPSPQTAGR